MYVVSSKEQLLNVVSSELLCCYKLNFIITFDSQRAKLGIKGFQIPETIEDEGQAVIKPYVLKMNSTI